jgi:hypothetical protein
MGIRMKTLQINVYALDWTYLGCFWTVNSMASYRCKEVGDYAQATYDGPLLTKEGKELAAIQPLKCYLKVVEEKATLADGSHEN